MHNLNIRKAASVSHAWPQKYALPGQTDADLFSRAIDGVRSGIVHALTYYGLPPEIDHKIDVLPDEKYFQALMPVQKDYLSFAVYSLKQMTAAGTLSAENAWTLFNWELNNISQVSDGNFESMRECFFIETAKLLKTESRLNNDVGKPDLLQFEFIARAGQAGLEQFERYNEWASALIFEGVPGHLKNEYRKTLWLEMRIIETQVGITGLNEDIKSFALKKYNGSYSELENKVEGSIDIFKETLGAFPIESTIKAEIGHWMFVLYYLADWQKTKWAAELMDRMNKYAYTEAINNAFFIAKGEMSPVQRAFCEGVYSLDPERSGLPYYPVSFVRSFESSEPEHLFMSAESARPHLAAECVEFKIRQRIRKAVVEKELDPAEAYQTYRKLGVFIAILNLRMHGMGEILDKVEKFNIDEIKDYFCNYKNKTLAVLKAALKGRTCSGREAAARGMILIKGLKEDQDEYKKLHAFVLVGQGKWEEVISLDKLALPALGVALRERDPSVRAKAAQSTIKIKGLKEDQDEYKKLHAFVLVWEYKWDAVVTLGRRALPALEVALHDEVDLDDWWNPSARSRPAEAIEAIKRANPSIT